MNFNEKSFYEGKGYFSICYGLSYDRSNGFYNEEDGKCNPMIGHVIDFIFVKVYRRDLWKKRN